MSARRPTPRPPTDYARWAAVYDLFYEVGPEHEVEFYLRLMSECQPPVLELAVGTGRIAVPAALAGHRVTGIDSSLHMLDAARRKRADAGVSADALELVQGDMRDFDLGGMRFGLVIIPGNSLALVLEAPEQRSVIANAVRHLLPGGTLAFSLYNASDAILASDDLERFLIGVVEDPEHQRRYVISGMNRFDVAAQINRCTQYLQTVSAGGEVVETEAFEVVTRYLTRPEASEMVESCGLPVASVYGDFDRSPYSDTSDEMVFVCRRSD